MVQLQHLVVLIPEQGKWYGLGQQVSSGKVTALQYKGHSRVHGKPHVAHGLHRGGVGQAHAASHSGHGIRVGVLSTLLVFHPSVSDNARGADECEYSDIITGVCHPRTLSLALHHCNSTHLR